MRWVPVIAADLESEQMVLEWLGYPHTFFICPRKTLCLCQGNVMYVVHHV